MNLVNNAFESISQMGSVTLNTFNTYVDQQRLAYEVIDEGDYVVLEVEDNGEGISEDAILKIFEPFYTKKKMGRSGTGLGLAVVWGVVKDHKGFINLSSEKGKGTTISVYLPIYRGEPVDVEKSSVKLGGTETILVVDDIRSQRELATRLLSSLGYKVKSVSNGRKAINYLKNNNVDLLLLDMIMETDFDGLDTYLEIQKFKANQKVIVASGFSESDRVKEIIKIGAGRYIKKPYTLEAIGKAMREELDK